jgi:hypothetical protein
MEAREGEVVFQMGSLARELKFLGFRAKNVA